VFVCLSLTVDDEDQLWYFDGPGVVLNLEFRLAALDGVLLAFISVSF
jgi:hypothetical protein